MRKNKPVYFGAVVVFVVLNGLILAMRKLFERNNIDQDVVLYANVLFCLITIVALIKHKKALANPNPNVFLRSVMSATVLKLFIIAGGVFIYAATAGAGKTYNWVFVLMALYVIYTYIEVRTALALNTNKNEKN